MQLEQQPFCKVPQNFNHTTATDRSSSDSHKLLIFDNQEKPLRLELSTELTQEAPSYRRGSVPYYSEPHHIEETTKSYASERDKERDNRRPRAGKSSLCVKQYTDRHNIHPGSFNFVSNLSTLQD